MKAEEMLERYETFVKLGQPHNTTPIFLKENVLTVMKEYAKQEIQETLNELHSIKEYMESKDAYHGYGQMTDLIKKLEK